MLARTTSRTSGVPRELSRVPTSATPLFDAAICCSAVSSDSAGVGGGGGGCCPADPAPAAVVLAVASDCCAAAAGAGSTVCEPEAAPPDVDVDAGVGVADVDGGVGRLLSVVIGGFSVLIEESEELIAGLFFFTFCEGKHVG
jgi:hypothetical protein